MVLSVLWMLYNGVVCAVYIIQWCAVDVHARREAGGSAAQSAGQCSVKGGSTGECLTLHVYIYSTRIYHIVG